ncbi:MAG: YidC/Oxa1 family membrane protein insertase [Patescibacteria group bacterium]
MKELFETLLYHPFFNLLIFFYSVLPIHDLGIAIILLTILVKVILWPISWQQLKAQKSLQELQPKIKALQQQHKDDKQALGVAQMQLFTEHKVNPLTSCLPSLVQIPFLIALFYTFINGLKEHDFSILYSFIQQPQVLQEAFLGTFSLTASHNIPLAIVVGAAQFVQAWMLLPKTEARVKGSKDEDMTAMMNKQMTYMMPIMTGYFSYIFPSGLGLYWFTHSLLSILQQWLFVRATPAPPPPSTLVIDGKTQP